VFVSVLRGGKTEQHSEDNVCFTLFQFVECTFGSEYLAKIGKQPQAQLLGRSYSKPAFNILYTLTDVLILNQQL